ncbi:MAG: ParB/RepB/Spo0J family partition protein [Pseudomonadota bacterium]
MAEDFDEELDEILNPKKRGLGRGLGALFEDEEGDYPAVDEPTRYSEEPPTAYRKVVGIEKLFPNPDQPRQFFDDKAINDLAASIAEHGLLQPILVRPDKNDPDRYEIIAGERRWRACQKAQYHDVPIVICDLPDHITLEIALVENLVRQDLTPLEEARGYQRLAEEFGETHEEIGNAVSKSRSHVANMIRLLELPDSVQALLARDELSAGHARALLKAENPSLIASDVVAKGLSVRETEKLVAESAGRKIKKRGGKKSTKKFSKDADLLALEKSFSDTLGLNVAIDTADNKAGHVRIEFRNLDQLDDILQRLTSLPPNTDNQ